jgi:hypothetical protein
MESLLGEEEVWLRQARIIAQRSQNFWFDCWITLKCLQEFLEAAFRGVDMESLPEKEVC